MRLSVEEFEELQQRGRVRYLRALVQSKAWGGNAVPRGQIMPSYRGLGADTDRPVRPESQVATNTYLNAEQSGGEFHPIGLVFDLRHRTRGKVEKILQSD